MKAKNYNEAWTIAREIFPTPLQKDESSSQRAGYSVYRSTEENRYYCYICDLGDRLEINLDDGRTINVWIRPEESEAPDEISETVKAEKDARKFGTSARAFNVINKTQLVFSIGGYNHDTAEERAIYKALKAAEFKSFIIYEIAAAYCEANGLKYTTMSEPHAVHYEQSKDSSQGHYIISCYITQEQ